MSGEVLYLSRSDVEQAGLQMSAVMDAVEKAFEEKGAGRVEMPPKPGIHPAKDAFVHAMPAYVRALRAAGVKWVSGFPENQKKGLPYISGLIILNDPETGIPIAVMDATWITAKRTGAATGVAAKYLARSESSILGILGCGVQGRTNLEALILVFPGLTEVRAFDIDRDALSRYGDEMRAEHGVSIVDSSSPRGAVQGCDLVVTAGPILKDPHPVIEPSWFDRGGFACALDFDSYWTPAAMQSVDKFCTDDRQQLEYYKTVGYFIGVPEVYADLGEIVAGRKSSRESEEERTMSMNLGVAIEDMATAVRILDIAKSKGIGTWLRL